MMMSFFFSFFLFSNAICIYYIHRYRYSDMPPEFLIVRTRTYTNVKNEKKNDKKSLLSIQNSGSCKRGNEKVLSLTILIRLSVFESFFNLKNAYISHLQRKPLAKPPGSSITDGSGSQRQLEGFGPSSAAIS